MLRLVAIVLVVLPSLAHAGATIPPPTVIEHCVIWRSLETKGSGQAFCFIEYHDMMPAGEFDIIVDERMVEAVGLAVPWDTLAVPFENIRSIKTVTEDKYKNYYQSSLTGGYYYDGRKFDSENTLTVTMWGKPALDMNGASQAVTVTYESSFDSNGEPVWTADPFLMGNSNSSSRCAAGVLGGFISGAIAGANSGRSTAAGTPPQVQMGLTILAGAGGAVGGALTAAAVFCFGDDTGDDDVGDSSSEDNDTDTDNQDDDGSSANDDSSEETEDPPPNDPNNEETTPDPEREEYTESAQEAIDLLKSVWTETPGRDVPNGGPDSLINQHEPKYRGVVRLNRPSGSILDFMINNPNSLPSIEWELLEDIGRIFEPGQPWPMD